jgi:GTP-binding protein HflX
LYENINGNTAGLPRALIEEMKGLYQIREPRGVFISVEFCARLAAYTAQINREISVLIARDGMVLDVSVGHFDRVSMPELRTIRSKTRLSGLRCIHTHPNASGELSGVDLATLAQARFDAMAAIGVYEGKATDFFVAYLTGEEEPESEMYGPFDPARPLPSFLMRRIAEADKAFGRFEAYAPKTAPEKAVLVGLEEDGMDELAELARTAGAQVVYCEVQSRPNPDNAFYIGSGKAQELSMMRGDLGAEMFIFDGELSAVQLRNLEGVLQAKIVDRTTLILDIFATRAQSREGKLQVELAQLKYMLPRLMGAGVALSRLGAGIGTRGPGETKLETDRRRIRRRIHELQDEIDNIAKQREVRRSRRLRENLFSIALVGYTNAGKSTLLNLMTGAQALVEDKLFATLDPLARRAEIGGHEVVITDTVGFVRKLPHDLVDAFRSTLEETVHADLVVHVVDASHPEREAQMEVVDEVLGQLGAGETPRILVFNKMDKAQTPAQNGAIAISATRNEGIDALHAAITAAIEEHYVQMEVVVPYARGEMLGFIRSRAVVLEEEYETLGTRMKIRVPRAVWAQIEKRLPVI